jgi:hypothetical protein
MGNRCCTDATLCCASEATRFELVAAKPTAARRPPPPPGCVHVATFALRSAVSRALEPEAVTRAAATAFFEFSLHASKVHGNRLPLNARLAAPQPSNRPLFVPTRVRAVLSFREDGLADAAITLHDLSRLDAWQRAALASIQKAANVDASQESEFVAGFILARRAAAQVASARKSSRCTTMHVSSPPLDEQV